MSVKCGNRDCQHGNEHPTVQQVRECYHNSTLDKPDPSVSEGEPVWPPTEKQLDYFKRLLAERVWPHEYGEDDIAKMDRSEVSSIIGGLRNAPHKAGKEPDRWKVPQGRYALEREGPMPLCCLNSGVGVCDDAPHVDFYQVDVPTEGKWRGYTFVNRLIGAPGDFQKTPLRYAEAERVLGRIQKDPAAASRRFGLRFMVCGRCGSPLTNEESRRDGIGPVCRNKLGW